MARKGSKTITFDVIANTSQPESELSKLDGKVEKLKKDASGAFAWKVTLNGENQLLQFEQLVSKWNKSGDNELSVTFDQEALQKSWGATRESVEAGMKELANTIKNYLNLDGIFKDSFGGQIRSNLDGELSTYSQKVMAAQEKVNKELEKAKAKMKSMHEEDLASAYEGKTVKDFVRFQELYRKVGSDRYLSWRDVEKNGVTGKNGTYDIDQLEEYNRKVSKWLEKSKNDSKYKDDIKEANVVIPEQLGERYKTIFNNIKTGYNELKKNLYDGFVSENDLDALLSGNFDINQIMKNAKANRKLDQKQDIEQKTFQELEPTFTINEADITSIRERLEAGLKNIKIEVDVDSSQIDKIRRKIKDGDASDYADSNQSTLNSYNKIKNKKDDNIRAAMQKLIRESVNNNGSLDEQQQKELAGMAAAYEKKNRKFNKKTLYKSAGLDSEKYSDDIFGNVDSLKDELKSYLADVDAGIKVPVSLEINSEDMSSLQNQVESKLDNVTIKIGNVEGLEDAVTKSVSKTIKNNFNNVLKQFRQEADATKEEQLKQKTTKTSAKAKKQIISDADQKALEDEKEKADEAAKKTNQGVKLSFATELKNAKADLAAITKGLNELSKTGQTQKITIGIKLNQKELSSADAKLKKFLEPESKDIDIKIVDSELVSVNSKLENILKDETKTIHINFDNLDTASQDLAANLEKAFNTLGINNSKKIAEKLPDKIDEDKLVKKEQQAAEDVDKNEHKVEVQTNAEEVKSEFDDVYEAMQKVFDASKSNNIDLFDDSIDELETLMNDKYAAMEDLTHNTDLTKAFKDNDVNGAISRLNEIFDIDMSWVDKQVAEAVGVVQAAKQQMEGEPIELNVDANTTQAENKYSKLLDLVKQYNDIGQSDSMQSYKYRDLGIVGSYDKKYAKASQLNEDGSVKLSSIKSVLKKYNTEYNKEDYNPKLLEQFNNQLLNMVSRYNGNDDDLNSVFKNNTDMLKQFQNRIEAQKTKHAQNGVLDDTINEIKNLFNIKNSDKIMGLKQSSREFPNLDIAKQINDLFGIDINSLSESINSSLDEKESQVDALSQQLQAKYKNVYDKLQQHLSKNSYQSYQGLLKELANTMDDDTENVDQMLKMATGYFNDNKEWNSAESLTSGISKMLDSTVNAIENYSGELEGQKEKIEAATSKQEAQVDSVIDSIQKYKTVLDKLEQIQNLKDSFDYTPNSTLLPQFNGDKLETGMFYGKNNIENNSTKLKSIEAALKGYKENKAVPKKYQKYANYNEDKLIANVAAYTGDQSDLDNLFGNDKELLAKIQEKIAGVKKYQEARELLYQAIAELEEPSGVNQHSIMGSITNEFDQYINNIIDSDSFIDSLNEKLNTNIPKIEEAKAKLKEYNEKKNELVEEKPTTKTTASSTTTSTPLTEVEEVKETTTKSGFDVPINLSVKPTVQEVQSDINSLKGKDVDVTVKSETLTSLKTDIDGIESSKPVNIKLDVNPEVSTIQSQIDSVHGKDVNIDLHLNSDKMLSLSPANQIDKLVDEYIKAGQQYANTVKKEVTGVGDYKVNDAGKLRSVAQDRATQNKAINESIQNLNKLKKQLFAIEDKNADFIGNFEKELPDEGSFISKMLDGSDFDVDSIKKELKNAIGALDSNDNLLKIQVDPGDSIVKFQDDLVQLGNTPIAVKFDASQSLKQLQVQLGEVADKAVSKTELSSAIKQEGQSDIKKYWKKYDGLLAKRNKDGEITASLNKYLDESDINKAGTSTNIKKLSGVITKLKSSMPYDEGYEELFKKGVQLLSGVDTSDPKKASALNKLKENNSLIFEDLTKALNNEYAKSISEMAQLTPKSSDIIDKAIAMSKKNISQEQKGNITESYLNALSTGGYKDAIESLNKSLNIKLPLDNLEKSVSTGLTTNLTAVSNIMNELTTSAIPNMGTAFANAANDIDTQTGRIKTSISSIGETVKTITDTLSSAGLTDINHLEGYEKELKQLEKERQSLTKERESAQKEVEQAKTQASTILSDAKEKAQNIKNKANESAQKIKDKADETKSKAEEAAQKIKNKANEEVQKQQEQIKKQQEALNKQQENLDVQDTQNVGFERNKELLKKYADNTNNFTLDESSVKLLANGMIEFSGSLETTDGKIVQVTQSYRALSDVAAKTTQSLKQGFLKEGIIPDTTEVENQVQDIQKAVENAVNTTTSTEETPVEKQLTAYEKQVEAIKKVAAETKNFNLDENSIVDKGDGFVEFTAQIMKANGEAKTLLYTVKDINDFTTGKGNLPDKFINGGIDVTPISEEEAKLTEIEKKIRDIKKAAALTQNFNVKEESITDLGNGFVQFTAEVEQANGSVKEFMYTLKEVNSFTTGKGNFKNQFVNKGKSVDAIQQLEEAKEQAKAYKEKIENISEDNLSDLQLRAKKQLAKVAFIKSDNLETGVDDKYKKTLSEQDVQEQRSLIRDLLNDRKQLDESFSDLEFGKINIDPSGFITIESSFKDASGAIQDAKYQFEDLSKMINSDTLSTTRNNFAEAFVSASDKLKNNTNIEDLKNQIIQMEQGYATYNSTVSADPTARVEKNNINALEEEIELINQLNKAMDEKNMSDKDKQSVYDDILDKSKINTDDFINLKTAQGSARETYSKIKDEATKLFSSIPDDDNLGKKFINKMIDVDGVETPLIARIKEMRQNIIDAFTNLENGDFKNDNALKSYMDYISKELKNFKNTINNKNNTTDNIFGDKFDATGMTNGEITKFIKEQFAKKYGRGGLKVSEYDPDKGGSTVEFNDNGTIQKVTVLIDTYVEAMNKASEANKKASETSSEAAASMDKVGDAAKKASEKVDGESAAKKVAEDATDDSKVMSSVIRETTKRTNVRKYQTAGQSWFEGVKAKIGNLTQYVTGIDIVMRAWNEIQQGFSFVKEFDSALTTINQTMSATQEQLAALGQGSIDAGKQLGASAQDVLDAAAIYANANETTESILTKAKPTMLLANASGADASTAADQIQGV